MVITGTLRRIRLRLGGLPQAQGNNYWLPTRSDRHRHAYISANRDLIQAAAGDVGLPPALLAGIAWREVNGEPRFLDDLAYYGRRVIGAVIPGTRDRDKTSMGPLAVQVRRAAEVLGYDASHLSGGERREVVRAVRDPGQNVCIAALYLASLKAESDFAGASADGLTDAQLRELAARYNGGPYYQVDAAQAYADAFARDLERAAESLR